MRGCGFRFKALVLLLTLALAGCAHASWESYQRSPNYSIPSTLPIWVDITEEVEKADLDGYTATMIQTMDAELAARGVQAQIFTPNVGPVQEKRQLPRVEIIVRNWKQGSAAVREIAPFGGEPKLVVECTVLSADNQKIFVGRMESSQTDSGEDHSRDVAETAEVAGKLLASTIAGR